MGERRFRTVPIEVTAYEAATEHEVQTMDGSVVLAKEGDWVITGPRGDQFVCPAAQFVECYVEIKECCECGGTGRTITTHGVHFQLATDPPEEVDCDVCQGKGVQVAESGDDEEDQ